MISIPIFQPKKGTNYKENCNVFEVTNCNCKNIHRKKELSNF